MVLIKKNEEVILLIELGSHSVDEEGQDSSVMEIIGEGGLGSVLVTETCTSIL